MQTLRICTFNVENIDDQPNVKPTLNQRIALMRPQLSRVNADILCLQEINGQKEQNTIQLQALEKLLNGTPYATYNKVFTTTSNGHTL